MKSRRPVNSDVGRLETMSMQLVLGIYGAALSTCLAILTVAKFLRERPKVSVEATPITMAASEGADTHGVLVQVRHGDDLLWEEADIEIRVRNSGAQACQISDVFVETPTVIQQIRPNGLPVVLDPNMSHSVRVQPEYFAPKRLGAGDSLEAENVVAVGVMDGLGKKHNISSDNLAKLANRCATLPVRTAVFRHKQTGNAVVAFQVRDPSTMVSKT